MNAEPTIHCPNRRADIILTESLAAPMLAATKADYDKKLSQQAAEFARRDLEIRAKEGRTERGRFLI